MSNPVISEADYEQWVKHGYVVVRLLDDATLRSVLDNVYDYFPSWDEYERRPNRYEPLLATAAGTLGPRVAFPFVGTALNSVSTHPELLAFARRVIGVDRIMITHSVLIGKYAGARDYEQDLHVDYGNNTLVYPKPDTAIVDLPTITYYSDVTVDLGRELVGFPPIGDPYWDEVTIAGVAARYPGMDMEPYRAS